MIDEKKLIEQLRESNYHHASSSREEVLLDRTVRIVQEQPKVGEWIPCSERLPEKVDSYLVTMKNVGEYRWIGISMYFGDGKWAWDDDKKEVIAWMAKPELYSSGD